jgi:hypothetical protein
MDEVLLEIFLQRLADRPLRRKRRDCTLAVLESEIALSAQFSGGADCL